MGTKSYNKAALITGGKFMFIIKMSGNLTPRKRELTFTSLCSWYSKAFNTPTLEQKTALRDLTERMTVYKDVEIESDTDSISIRTSLFSSVNRPINTLVELVI